MKKKINKATKTKFLNILSIVLIAVVFVMITLLTKSNNRLQTLLHEQAALAAYANDFGDASAYLTNEVRNYAATGQSVHVDNYYFEVDTGKNREKACEAMYAIGLSEEEKAMINTINETSNKLIPLEEKAMSYVKSGNKDTAQSILYGIDYEEGLNKIDEITHKFNQSIEERTSNDIAKLQKNVQFFNITVYLSTAVVLLVQIYIIYFVLKELIHPIIAIKDVVTELAQGNLSAKIDLPEDTTETGTTATALHEMQRFQTEIINDIDFILTEMAAGNFNILSKCTENYKGDYLNILLSLRKIKFNLSDTLLQINQSADQVFSGSEQVSAAAQGLSQGATEQAASIQELSATISEVSAQMKNTTTHTEDANALVMGAKNALDHSIQEMGSMLAAMDRINKKSTEISKIIKTIDDIAFQTNILALNAAVEAARAGSAGKGFAVVADEVRNLAQKCADAAQNTTVLIEDTVQAVDNGTKIASETERAVNSIVENAEQVGAIVEKIKFACETESNSIQQILIGIDQISSVVQTNSATAEESAAASEELSGQSAILKQLVDKFTFSNTDNSSASYQQSNNALGVQAIEADTENVIQKY